MTIVFGERDGGTEAPPPGAGSAGGTSRSTRTMPAKPKHRKSAFEALLAFDRHTGRAPKRERVAPPSRQGTLL